MKKKHFDGFETLSLFLILHFFFLTNKFLHIRIVKSFFNGFPLVQINLVNKELGFKFSVCLRSTYFVETENFSLKVL